MTTFKPVILVDIIGSVVNAMVVPGISYINYQAGRNLQILKSLNDLDNSISYKNKKYPLIALGLPIREDMTITEYYAVAKISRIVIATISVGTDDINERYKVGGTFKSILYPCYYEFLSKLAMSPDIIGVDPNAFKHTKMDNPGNQPLTQGSSDYIDSIEILGLEITLNQIKTC